jgi:hypothetical protein
LRFIFKTAVWNLWDLLISYGLIHYGRRMVINFRHIFGIFRCTIQQTDLYTLFIFFTIFLHLTTTSAFARSTQNIVDFPGDGDDQNQDGYDATCEIDLASYFLRFRKSSGI